MPLKQLSPGTRKCLSLTKVPNMTLTKSSGTTLTNPDDLASDFIPLIDTRKGRLAELVHLLADVPFDQALVELEAVGTPGPAADPLWLVAGALVGLASKGH